MFTPSRNHFCPRAPRPAVSILFDAMLGARLLKEGDRGRRLIAAAAMALGVVALALG
jgi:hypothetical protein